MFFDSKKGVVRFSPPFYIENQDISSDRLSELWIGRRPYMPCYFFNTPFTGD